MSSTIRHENLPSRNYVLINAAWLRDTALSWEARGLLAWLATFGPNDEITEDLIAEASGIDLKAVADGPTGELEARGYLIPDPTSDSATVAYVLNDPHA